MQRITHTSTRRFWSLPRVRSRVNCSHYFFYPSNSVKTPSFSVPTAAVTGIPVAKFSTARSFQAAHRQSVTMPGTEDARISDVLDFWFGLTPETWFRDVSKELDDKVRDKFGALVTEARTSALDATWTATARGALALIIVLDQFPRNIYRGSGESFASDPHAARLAARAVADGFDLEITTGPAATLFHRLFFYLPLMHAEDLTAQVACAALIDVLARDCPADAVEAGFLKNATGMAKSHRDCVALHGRFPKRNDWLGRETTAEEKVFLEEHPHGF